MFLSAGDLTVPREVLQHMYNSLVEQVKRKVARLSFTVKNLTLVFYHLHWQISRFTVWGNDKFKKNNKHETSKFRSGMPTSVTFARRGCYLEYSIHGKELDLILLRHRIKKIYGFSVHAIPDS